MVGGKNSGYAEIAEKIAKDAAKKGSSIGKLSEDQQKAVRSNATTEAEQKRATERSTKEAAIQTAERNNDETKRRADEARKTDQQRKEHEREIQDARRQQQEIKDAAAQQISAAATPEQAQRHTQTRNAALAQEENRIRVAQERINQRDAQIDNLAGVGTTLTALKQAYEDVQNHDNETKRIVKEAGEKAVQDETKKLAGDVATAFTRAGVKNLLPKMMLDRTDNSPVVRMARNLTDSRVKDAKEIARMETRDKWRAARPEQKVEEKK